MAFSIVHSQSTRITLLSFVLLSVEFFSLSGASALGTVFDSAKYPGLQPGPFSQE